MDQQLIVEIKSSLASNIPKEEIYKTLLTRGVTLTAIEAGFAAIYSEENKVDTQKKTVHIILVIAALLIAAGIFSFIASNWQVMTKPVKVVVILVTMIIAYGLGWYCKEQKKLEKTGEAFFLLGVLIYGAGIFLVGQIFNITSNWPDAFILWMLGTLALAFALESLTFFYLAIPLGLVAVFWYPIDILNEYNTTFLFTSTFLLVFVTFITFVTGVIMRKRIPTELKDHY